MKLPFYAQRYISPLQQYIDNPTRTRRHKKIDKLLVTWSKVLDIGCASGWFYYDWKHKDIDFYGVDYNEDLVKFCVDQWLNVQQCDLSTDSLPFEDNSFDFVYCSHVLEHILTNEQIRFFAEVSRVLKPWGYFVLFTPTPYNRYFWDDPTHQRPSTHGSLMHLAKDFWFDVIEAKYSNIRFFSQSLQRILRLPPLRWFLWEVYLVVQKK